MSAKPVSPDELQSNYDTWLRCGKDKAKAAREIGIPRATLVNRIARYEQITGKSDDLLPDDTKPGFKADIDKKAGKGWLELVAEEMPSEDDVLSKYGLDPACWRVTRVVPNQYQSFYRQKDRTTHTVVTLHSLRVYIERSVPESIEEVALKLAAKIKPLPKPPTRNRRKKTEEGQLAVLGLYDAHIGAYAWAGEVEEDNDTELAATRCKNAIDDLCDDLARYPIEKMLLPIGNDFMHYDNARGETTSGRVVTEFDSRYPRVVETCHEVLCHLVDRALEVCDDVELVFVGGNHDFMTSLHLTHWLAQRYRNDPRVSVDTVARKRKYRMWKSVLIGFAHGDGLNLKEVYRHMAEESRENWANATCREFHFGDKHHRKQIDQKTVDSYGRVTLRQNPSLSPRDKWTYDNGYDSLRCADVWRYDGRAYRGMSTAYPRQ